MTASEKGKRREREGDGGFGFATNLRDRSDTLNYTHVYLG